MPEASKPSRGDAASEQGEPVACLKIPGHAKALNNLPTQLSSLIGRDMERAEVAGLLSDRRLLTLTGPGGSGKTRLALAMAKDVLGGFENGVWWVALVPLSDPELLPQAVASVLGLREQPGRSLAETLTARRRWRQDLPSLWNQGWKQTPSPGGCAGRGRCPAASVVTLWQRTIVLRKER